MKTVADDVDPSVQRWPISLLSRRPEVNMLTTQTRNHERPGRRGVYLAGAALALLLGGCGTLHATPPTRKRCAERITDCLAICQPADSGCEQQCQQTCH